MAKSTITSKRRPDIPKKIRDQMGLKPAEAINTNFLSLKGIIKSPHGRRMTLAEMDEAIARGVVDEVMRSLGK